MQRDRRRPPLWGAKFLIISLEFNPRDEVLTWANEVVGQHPDRRSRSIAKGAQQWTFEDYMDLWNKKIDPFDVKPGWRMGIKQGTTMAIKHFISRGLQETGGRGLTALAPVEMGGAFLKAGPNMYVILYYRLLQNGMINAILMEDFGVEGNLYDVQDFCAGL